MSLTFKVDHENRFVDATAQDRVVLRDIEEYLDALVVQDAMPYPKLFDATHAYFDVSDDDMMLLGARVSAYAAIDPRGPLCLVAVTDHGVDMLRRFTNLGGASRPAKIFGTVEEGRRWLAEQAR